MKRENINIWEKKLVDINSRNNLNQARELEKVKNELFSGYDIDLKKFIKGLKKKEIISMEKIINE